MHVSSAYFVDVFVYAFVLCVAVLAFYTIDDDDDDDIILHK
jgi:hypothetical protein